MLLKSLVSEMAIFESVLETLQENLFIVHSKWLFLVIFSIFLCRDFRPFENFCIFRVRLPSDHLRSAVQVIHHSSESDNRSCHF